MSEPHFSPAPLEKAVHRLDEGLTRYQKDTTDSQIRDGLVQRFEFTYEISHRLLRRFLAVTAANPAEIDEMTFQNLIRTGNERGLLSGSWADWKQYREMRARTSHTYDENVAVEVVSGIPAFLTEAKHLLARLQSRSA